MRPSRALRLTARTASRRRNACSSSLRLDHGAGPFKEVKNGMGVRARAAAVEAAG